MYDSWTSYPKIWNVGHPNVKELLKKEVVVEEKIDGSQFSFGIFDGELRCRSKNRQLVLDEPDGMFVKAVETVQSISHRLVDGWTYRAEYLQKPKHNGLAYDRVPVNHLIIFDVAIGLEDYAFALAKQHAATALGLESVPVLFRGMLTADMFGELLQKTSVLGGAPIEGVVIKCVGEFGVDSKPLLAKYVSPLFREIQRRAWTKSNPTQGDVLQQLETVCRSEARWLKAVQRARDNGTLTSSPKDIGALIRVVQEDMAEECVDIISRDLLKWAMPKLKRASIRGLPEWYKEQLMKQQFGGES